MAISLPPNNNTGLYNTANVTPPTIGNVTYVTNLQASGNILANGYISATGNITTAGYFVGDGSQLTNLPAGSYSNANVANFLPTFSGNLTAGNVSATGNISGNYIIGNGSQLTGLAATYDNANVATFLAAFGSNTISTTGTVTSGNVTGGNIFTAGVVSATGNVTGNFFIGNGSQLTGIAATYDNANVATFLAAFGSNTISTTGTITSGNVTGNFFIGDGSQLTNLPAGSYSNANVSAFLGSGLLTANILTTGRISVAANITTAGNLIVTGPNVIAQSLELVKISAVGNITGGNVLTVGFVSATGNVTGNFFIGNGSQLTGIAASTYSDANVATFLAAFGSNTISTTGTVNSGNVTGTNLFTAGVVSATGNVNGANVIGSYLYGDGSNITNLPGGNYSNSNVTSLMAAFGSNTISTTGTITSGNVTGSNIFTAGQVSATGNVTGNFFIGDGSQLTNLPVQAGTYSNANVANYLPIFSGNLAANNVSVTGNVTGNFFIGNGSLLTGVTATSATTAATVTTNAQPNITSVGTLTVLSSSGNITGANILTGGIVSATGNITAGNVIATNIGNVAALNLNGNASQVLYGNGVFAPVAGSSTYGDANVNTLLAAWGSNTLSTTGNVAVGNLNMTGQVFDASGVLQLNAVGNIVLAPTGSTITSSPISATGDITGANILTGGLVSATGNVTGANIIANDTNARVDLTGGTTNRITLAAAGVGGPANTAYSAGAKFVLYDTVSPSSTGYAIGLDSNSFWFGTEGSAANIDFYAGTTNTARITGAGVMSVIGNIIPAGILTDNYYYANGTPVTFGGGSYSDANVATFLAAFGSNTVSTTGTITSGNITGGNIATAGLITATGNITGGNILTTGTISASANVVFGANANIEGGRIQTANATASIFSQSTLTTLFLSTGANLVNVSAFTGANVNSILVGSSSATGNITLRGNVTVSGNATTGTGNLTVTSGNISIGGVANAAYLKTTASTFYLLNTANQVIIGNISANVGNVTTGANISAVGNVTGGNIFTAGIMSSTGNAIHGNIATAGLISATGNISTNSFMTVKTYTAAALNAITGATGQLAAVSDSASGGNPNGLIAFWDTTHPRWSYIHDNSAV